jgi:ketosteroid isomerase-like protein
MSPDKEKDEDAVKKWVETYLTLVRTGEIDKWYSLWAEDVVMLPPNMRPLHGMDALKGLVGPGFGRFDIGIEVVFSTEFLLPFLCILPISH